MQDGNGFDQYKQLILHELREQSDSIKRLTLTVNHVERTLAEFQGKAKVMSVVAGVVSGGIMSILVSLIVAFVR